MTTSSIDFVTLFPGNGRPYFGRPPHVLLVGDPTRISRLATRCASRRLMMWRSRQARCFSALVEPWDGGLSKRILSSRRLGGPGEILPVARRGSRTRHRSTTIRDVIRARSRPCRPRPSTAHLISRADDNCHSERTRKMPRIVSGLFGGTSNKNPRGVSHVRGKQRNSHSHH